MGIKAGKVRNGAPLGGLFLSDRIERVNLKWRLLLNYLIYGGSIDEK
jgi:hypothetical protein